MQLCRADVTDAITKDIAAQQESFMLKVDINKPSRREMCDIER